MPVPVPNVAPYVVPMQGPERPKETEKIQTVTAIRALREAGKGDGGQAATVEISEEARELARAHLEKYPPVT